MSLAHASTRVSPPRSVCPAGLISALLLRSGCGDLAAFATLLDLIYPAVAAAAAAAPSADGSGSAAADDDILAAFVALWQNAPMFHPGVIGPMDWIMRVAVPA